MRMYFTSLSIFLATLGLVVGCSNVGFNSVPKQSCSDDNYSSNTSCTVQGQNLAYNFSFQFGAVDIVIVDDNSGSMYALQTKMANAMSSFLGQISNLFYQIAIVTTDISTSPNQGTPKPANGYGAFQDGKFLEFTGTAGNDSGLKIITPSTANKQDLFLGTIKRNETLACEQGGFTAGNCPSNDERAIYSLNLAIANNEQSFFRPGVYTAFVIISNEDERSDGTDFEDNDEPATLVSNMTSKNSTKSFGVYSIVTNDDACLASQTVSNPNRITTTGYMGTTYMSLSNPSSALTALGAINAATIGSVCATDYGAQLTTIGADVAKHSQNNPIQLACKPDPTTISISATPAQYTAQIQSAIDSQNRITFSNIPLGTTINFSYTCPQY